MKQFSLATIPLVCAAIAPLSADQMSNGNQQMMKADQVNQQNWMNNTITPEGMPATAHWADPFVTADFIWWKAQEEGLDFAYSGVQQTANSHASKGHVHHPEFKYEPGFKVGLGLKFDHDGFDFFAEYTWIHFNDVEDTARHKNTQNNNLWANLWLQYHDVISTSPATGASNIGSFVHKGEGSWQLHFNNIDLELGRNYWISKWLALRPFVGLKVSWMEQNFHAEYHVNDASHSFDRWDYHMYQDQDQWGVGVRAGLNTVWYLWKHVGIFGDFALSGMYNHFDTERRDKYRNNQSLFTKNLNTEAGFYDVTAVLEWALGARFDTAFHNDDYYFYFQAGWEQQLWFNQNQFFYLAEGKGSGNLSMQGLTLEMGFYF